MGSKAEVIILSRENLSGKESLLLYLKNKEKINFDKLKILVYLC